MLINNCRFVYYSKVVARIKFGVTCQASNPQSATIHSRVVSVPRGCGNPVDANPTWIICCSFRRTADSSVREDIAEARYVQMTKP